MVDFRSLNGKEYAHTIHGFEVKIHSSSSSAIEEVDSGSSKVCWFILVSHAVLQAVCTRLSC